MSSTHDTYRHPQLDQTDYRYYHPQVFTSSKNDYSPNKGTKEWFQDYRRSQVTERTLKKNLLSIPIRPY